MSDAAALLPETPPADPASDWARARVEQQLAVLDQVAEAGLEIVAALAAQAKGGRMVVVGDIAMAYARVARAVRQTVMLQAKLIKDLEDGQAARASAAENARADQRRERRYGVGRIVGRMAGTDSETAERLACEAAERLKDEDIYGELLGRPIGELVAIICQDMGLPEPDWSRMDGEAWVEAERAQGDWRSPYAEDGEDGEEHPPPFAAAEGGPGPPLVYEPPT